MTGSAKVFSGRHAVTCGDHVCQSLKFLVASICDLPDVINCQFRECDTALLGPAHFLSRDQPTVWNSLLDHLRDPAADFKQFRRDLKMYLFAGHSKRKCIRGVM